MCHPLHPSHATKEKWDWLNWIAKRRSISRCWILRRTTHFRLRPLTEWLGFSLILRSFSSLLNFCFASPCLSHLPLHQQSPLPPSNFLCHRAKWNEEKCGQGKGKCPVLEWTTPKTRFVPPAAIGCPAVLSRGLGWGWLFCATVDQG